MPQPDETEAQLPSQTDNRMTKLTKVNEKTVSVQSNIFKIITISPKLWMMYNFLQPRKYDQHSN